MIFTSPDSTDIGSKFRDLLAGKIKNRPLVWLWGAVPSFAVEHAGYPVAAAYNDPQKSFEAQIETIPDSVTTVSPAWQWAGPRMSPGRLAARSNGRSTSIPWPP